MERCRSGSTCRWVPLQILLFSTFWNGVTLLLLLVCRSAGVAQSTGGDLAVSGCACVSFGSTVRSGRQLPLVGPLLLCSRQGTAGPIPAAVDVAIVVRKGACLLHQSCTSPLLLLLYLQVLTPSADDADGNATCMLSSSCLHVA